MLTFQYSNSKHVNFLLSQFFNYEKVIFFLSSRKNAVRIYYFVTSIFPVLTLHDYVFSKCQVDLILKFVHTILLWKECNTETCSILIFHKKLLTFPLSKLVFRFLLFSSCLFKQFHKSNLKISCLLSLLVVSVQTHTKYICIKYVLFEFYFLI